MYVLLCANFDMLLPVSKNSNNKQPTCIVEILTIMRICNDIL